PPGPPPLPYTTLFRSLAAHRDRHQAHLADLRRRYPRLLTTPTPSPTVSASVSASPTAAAKVSRARMRALERRAAARRPGQTAGVDRKSTRLNSSHVKS